MRRCHAKLPPNAVQGGIKRQLSEFQRALAEETGRLESEQDPDTSVADVLPGRGADSDDGWGDWGTPYNGPLGSESDAGLQGQDAQPVTGTLNGCARANLDSACSRAQHMRVRHMYLHIVSIYRHQRVESATRICLEMLA